MELLIFDKTLKSWSICFFVSGKKPKKKNFPEKPLAANAAITELGPGILKIFIFSFNASFTKTEPGSEMHGVPASDIREITNYKNGMGNQRC